MAEFEDDELERRMRAKLFSEPSLPTQTASSVSVQFALKPAVRLNEEEQQIARLLLGHDNAERIVNAKEGRRVRPLPPPVVTFEWYDIPGDWQNMHKWRINRVENGTRRAQHAEHYDFDRLDEEIAKLEAKGFTVVENNLDRRPARKPLPKVSARKAALDELRFFRR